MASMSTSLETTPTVAFPRGLISTPMAKTMLVPKILTGMWVIWEM
ncbi:unnamed protein product [Acanthoscelides obtectus]|uniref:Uncharacterized protein n=1 Tax=Acanthoscelides obtectus TaxID=200917 RepID=A0A9P0L7V8_ACAOB|nr:unnamed protein product [Acanthoscelides obtectus]CAK1655215.1 hypothetical protein AOBTE_LOCUS19084 [Acanthoscelides obtectus]